MQTRKLAMECGLAVGCICCGNCVSLTQEEECSIYHGKFIVKICDECKEAISYVKQLMKDEDKMK